MTKANKPGTPAIVGDGKNGSSARIAMAGLAMLITLLVGTARNSTARRDPGTRAADLKMSVRVYDYVQVPDAVANAEEVATRIFRQAGIEVVWYDCVNPVPKRPGVSSCSGELGPTEVVLRIVPLIRVSPGAGHDAAGFAVGPYATVSFAGLMDLARNYSAPGFVILGRAMAHEIGHVLLRTSGHSPEGIMRAHWGGTELKVVATNDMFFTTDQGRALRLAVKTRTGQ